MVKSNYTSILSHIHKIYKNTFTNTQGEACDVNLASTNSEANISADVLSFLVVKQGPFEMLVLKYKKYMTKETRSCGFGDFLLQEMLLLARWIYSGISSLLILGHV